jgi:putative ABC transport system permease protein
VSLWRRLVRGVRALADREAADRDAGDEIEHYLAEATAAHLARGLAPEAARRAARLELGSPSGAREQVTRYGWENAVEELVTDLRHAARRLRARPGFTLTTVLTLATGIGATTATFSVVHPVLLQPLPYPEPRRILSLWDVGPDGNRVDVTFNTYREVAARSRSFEALAVTRDWEPTLQGSAEPERIPGQRVTAEYFRVLGTLPARGQAFQPSDDRAGAPDIVVIADALWRRRFGADPGIIGRSITLDGRPVTVVGIMPPGFENVPAPRAELWTPLRYDMSEDRAWGHHLRMLGRTRPGIGLSEVRRELDGIAARPVAEFVRVPWAGLPNGFLVTSLHEEVTRGVRPALLAVFGAVALVLMIACVNVTNLLLAHGVRRRGELALRAALGAGHGRLIRQLVTESLVLAWLGGLAGMAVAIAGVRTIVALSPAGMPRLGAVGVDGGVFAFGFALTTLVGLAFGMSPALAAARGSLHGHLAQGARLVPGAGRRTRGMLVVAEVALALVLLIGSGLLLRSLERLLAVEPGFEPPGLVTLQIHTSGARLADDAARRRYFAEVLEAVRRVPGVTAAALTSQLPLSGDLDLYGVHFDPTPADDRGEDRGTFRYAVSPGYLETLGIPLRRGRTFDPRDRADAPRVALISESVARRRLPGLDPLGARLRIGGPDTPTYTVVGVVGDVRQVSLALDEASAVYVPAEQWHFADQVMSLVVKAQGDPAARVPALRAAIWSVDRDQAIARVAAMESLVAASAAERRLAARLFQVFALASLVLAAAGIYGVLSGLVAERTREIGVRAALGASRGSIVGLIVRQGMTLAAAGIAIGLGVAAVATRALSSLLYGVSRLDPVTFLIGLGLLAGVALLACGLPALRAARVDPVLTLREE